MTDPVKIITFGGVKVDANSITSTKTVKENGATRFVISFKDFIYICIN